MDHAERMRRFHLIMMAAWGLALVPTLLWWKDSILWVASMSLYANIGAHWSAYQASRAEREVKNNGGAIDGTQRQDQ